MGKESTALRLSSPTRPFGVEVLLLASGVKPEAIVAGNI